MSVSFTTITKEGKNEKATAQVESILIFILNIIKNFIGIFISNPINTNYSDTKHVLLYQVHSLYAFYVLHVVFRLRLR